MNTLSWKDVTGKLKTGAARKDLPETGAFWTDFRARARLVRQEEPVVARDLIPAGLRWGAASVLALFLVVTGWFVLPGTLGAVTRYFAAYNLVCGPVLDDEGHLLGAVTVDDVLDHLLPDDWRETFEEAGAAQIGSPT
jgi:CBS domain-containing protein